MAPRPLGQTDLPVRSSPSESAPPDTEGFNAAIGHQGAAAIAGQSAAETGEAASSNEDYVDFNLRNGSRGRATRVNNVIRDGQSYSQYSIKVGKSDQGLEQARSFVMGSPELHAFGIHGIVSRLPQRPGAPPHLSLDTEQAVSDAQKRLRPPSSDGNSPAHQRPRVGSEPPSATASEQAFAAYIQYPESPAQHPDEDAPQPRSPKGKERAVEPQDVTSPPDQGPAGASDAESDGFDQDQLRQAIHASLHPTVPQTPLGPYQDPGAPAAWAETPAFSGQVETPAPPQRPAMPEGLAASLQALGSRRKSVEDLASTVAAKLPKQGPKSATARFERGLNALNKKEGRPPIDVDFAKSILTKETAPYFVDDYQALKADKYAKAKQSLQNAAARPGETRTAAEINRDRVKKSLQNAADRPGETRTAAEINRDRTKQYLRNAADRPGETRTAAEIQRDRDKKSLRNAADKPGETRTAAEIKRDRVKKSLQNAADRPGETRTAAEINRDRVRTSRKKKRGGGDDPGGAEG